MYLMTMAIQELRLKGLEISREEEQSAQIAILLHDIGHGPFSHALETSIVQNLSHEQISLLIMKKLNTEFDGKLTQAIEIFEGKYQKKFLHQLVSSQLDVDRLDYLRRDSFFTGVSEGVIGTQRIIKMMNVVDDNLVVEAKGIYSIENFLTSRRIMYWQVYLHKTVLAAEYLLMNILKRAKELCLKGENISASGPLLFFLNESMSFNEFESSEKALKYFTALDDIDILSAIKSWTLHPDFVLSTLSENLINRNLFHIELSKTPFEKSKVEALKTDYINKLRLNYEDISYFVFTDKVSTYTYKPDSERINILYKNGDILNIAQASDQLNVDALSKEISKYFLCFPKNK